MRVYLYKMNQSELEQDPDRALSLLPSWRKERYRQMHFPKGKAEELAAGLLLRHALMDAAGIDLLTAEVKKNEHGKPLMAGPAECTVGEVYFNISHSDGYVAVAVADVPVGIDVETKTDPGLKIMSRFYSQEEQSAVRAAEDPQKEFRRLWTRKEAYVKCVGTGIHGEVSEIPSLPDISGAYRLITLKEEEEYTLSVVLKSPDFSEILLDIVDNFDI